MKMDRTRVHPKSGGRPTRDDVAKMANISGATVSRVLSGRTDVSISPDARARVMDAAQKLGYRPNPTARALMNGRTGLIGFWMSLYYSRYRSQVLDHMRTMLGQTELAMAVMDVDEEYQWDHSFDRALRVPVDGIIAFDASASIEAFAEVYDRMASHTPFVSMGAYWSEKKSYVGVDLRAGAREAMAHLLETGRRKIAYMAPINSGLLTFGPRYEAYLEAMRESGNEPMTIGSETGTLTAVREAIEKVLDSPSRPEAILCMSDDVALAVTFAFQQLGIKTGSDIALVGFDGLHETEHCPCPITTVRQPVEEMCELTYDFLRAQMEDPTTPLQQKILKPTLVIRESSRA